MPEITFFPEVLCQEEPGIREGDVTASVRDVNGRLQFVQVTAGLISRDGGKSYLPVGFVDIQRRTRTVLIELPTEADSGANRLWVKFDDLRQEVSVHA